MKARTRIALLFVALMAVFQLEVLPAARADMTTTTETRMFLDKDRVEVGSKIRYARDHDERIEEHSKLGGFPVDETRINLCESNRAIVLDEKLNIYYETSFMWDDKYFADAKAKSDAIAAQKFPTDKTGTIVEIFQTTPLGEEMIAGVQSKGYLFKWHTEKTGSAKNLKDKVGEDGQVEYWFGDKGKVLTCFEVKYPDAFMGMYPIEKQYEIVNGSKISREAKDDSNIVGENFGKLLIRTKMYQDGKGIYSEEITKISEDKLSDALFTVPATAKKVDKAEYESARTQALHEGVKAIRAAAKAKVTADVAEN